MSRVLGLIPARGGSRGIPGKNLVPFAGQPLIVHTVRCACASRRLDRVIVSTDSAAIREVAVAAGAEAPFERPAALAADSSTAVEVIEHALAWLAVRDAVYEIVVYLQPTSPLRLPQDIDAAVDLLRDSGADVAVSVTEVPHRFAPDSQMHLDGDRLISSAPGTPVLDRHHKSRRFARNGPAVLAFRPGPVLERGHFYHPDLDVRALPMPVERSVDIDTPFDLAVAECARRYLEENP